MYNSTTTLIQPSPADGEGVKREGVRKHSLFWSFYLDPTRLISQQLSTTKNEPNRELLKRKYFKHIRKTGEIPVQDFFLPDIAGQ